MDSDGDVAKRLREAGIRPTLQRTQVAEVVLRKDQHLSAEQVLSELDCNGTPVSKATVYNTLGLFAAHGLVREVLIDAARVFYDSNTRPHHHFYNTDTGALVDFPASQVVIENLPAPPNSARIESVDLVIRLRNKG